MPHFTIQYSANLKSEFEVFGLFRAFHKVVVKVDVFPIGGIRFRAIDCKDYLVADSDADNAFVHITLKMGHGRPIEIKKAAEMLFASFCEYLQAIYDRRPLAISFEVTELNPELNFKQNNIHERLKEEKAR